VLGATAAVAVVAVAVAGWLVMGREPPPGERVQVVLGAMENGSGEAALDAVPGLLATALEPSRRVQVVRKERLALLSRQAGLGEPGRLDAERGRTLARIAGAPVLLLPSARTENGALSLRVAAVEVESGRPLFQAEAGLKRPADLAPAVDRLSDRIRRELKERGEDRSLRRPVAEAVTSNPEAARRYYEGIDCLERRRAGPSSSMTCAPLFEQALAQDPSFALAQYQLAVIRSVGGASPNEYRPYLDAALQAVDRLPAREAALVRALAARLQGRFTEAQRLYDEVLSASPEDAPALQAAADLEVARSDWRSALGYLEKLVALAPGQEEPLESLVEALGRLGRREDLRSLLKRLESSADSFDRSRAIVQGHLWLGEQQAALDFARRAATQRGDAELPTLRVALSAAGRFEELEAVAEREAVAKRDPWLRNHVTVALAAQGRVREALAINDEVARRSVAEDAVWRFRQRVFLLTVRWEVGALLRDAARANATSPEFNAQVALVLALLGDLQHAATPARSLPSGSVEQLEYAALVAWRNGDVDGALAQLDVAEKGDAWPVSALPPAYLIAEVSAAAGIDSETLSAVERFWSLPPRGFWRAFAYPRSLFLAAQAHARLGEHEEARREIDRLLTLWRHADPDLPLLRQARAMRARL
jgi:tetratricopeptide (TPR) repeat protein